MRQTLTFNYTFKHLSGLVHNLMQCRLLQTTEEPIQIQTASRLITDELYYTDRQ